MKGLCPETSSRNIEIALPGATIASSYSVHFRRRKRRRRAPRRQTQMAQRPPRLLLALLQQENSSSHSHSLRQKLFRRPPLQSYTTRALHRRRVERYRWWPLLPNRAHNVRSLSSHVLCRVWLLVPRPHSLRPLQSLQWHRQGRHCCHRRHHPHRRRRFDSTCRAIRICRRTPFASSWPHREPLRPLLNSANRRCSQWR